MNMIWPPSSESLADGRTEGWVHSVDSGGTVDGPGLRFVVFTAGCPLRCQYCHNPDCWHAKEGTKTTVQALLDEITTYSSFLGSVGGIGHNGVIKRSVTEAKARRGGVTISGGEPLVQPAFVSALLRGCKRLNLHTALDTSGFLGENADDALLEMTDLVLLDIKSYDPMAYKWITGVDLRPTLTFAERLAAMGKPVWLRYVLVPDLSDDLDAISGLADFIAGLGNVQRVEVLPFHKMGEYKWEALGLTYRLNQTQPPSQALQDTVRGLFEARGLNVV